MPYTPFRGVAYVQYNTPPEDGSAAFVGPLDGAGFDVGFDHNFGIGTPPLYPYGSGTFTPTQCRVPRWVGAPDAPAAAITIPVTGRYETCFDASLIIGLPFSNNDFSWDAGTVTCEIRQNGTPIHTFVQNIAGGTGTIQLLRFPIFANTNGQRYPSEFIQYDATAGDEITLHIEVDDFNVVDLDDADPTAGIYKNGMYLGTMWLVTNPDDTGELCIPHLHVTASKSTPTEAVIPETVPGDTPTAMAFRVTTPWVTGIGTGTLEDCTADPPESFLEGEQTLDLSGFPYVIDQDPMFFTWNTELCNPPATEDTDWHVTAMNDFIGVAETTEGVPAPVGSPWGTMKLALVDGIHIVSGQIFFTNLRAETTVDMLVSANTPGSHGTPVTIQYDGPLVGMAGIANWPTALSGDWDRWVWSIGGKETDCFINPEASIEVTGPPYECCDNPPPPPPGGSGVLGRGNQVNLIS